MRLRTRFWLLAATALLTTTGPAQRTAPMAVTSIGHWYNADDKARTLWLGFRICHVNQPEVLTISTGSATGRQFKLPFTKLSNSGPHWQRMNFEKSGCDLVLLEMPFKAGVAYWTASAPDGSKLLHGSVKIQGKGRPFSTPPPAGTVVKHKGKSKRRR